MKILIADDHNIVRLGTRMILQSRLVNTQFFEADNHEDVLKLVRSTQLDLLIMDIELREMTTIGFIRQLLILKPGLRIMILSQQPEELFGRHYIKARVLAYVDKKRSNELLGIAVDTVMQDRVFLTDQLKDDLFRMALEKDGAGVKLSDREVDVLAHILKGYTTQEIGARLNLQTNTVSTYKNRLFEKMRTNNMVEIKRLTEVLELMPNVSGPHEKE